jgi:hypothetical protein
MFFLPFFDGEGEIACPPRKDSVAHGAAEQEGDEEKSRSVLFIEVKAHKD